MKPQQIIAARILEGEMALAGYARQLADNPENALNKLSSLVHLTGSLLVLKVLRDIPPELWAQRAVEELIKAAQHTYINPPGIEIQLTREMNDTWAWAAQGGFGNPTPLNRQITPEQLAQHIEMLRSCNRKDS